MIERTESCTIITGPDISKFQFLSRKGALKLECLGMKRHGQSAYAICKQVYGLKGSKQKVLEQMEEMAKHL
jgi:hypothetical protein